MESASPVDRTATLHGFLSLPLGAYRADTWAHPLLVPKVQFSTLLSDCIG